MERNINFVQKCDFNKSPGNAFDESDDFEAIPVEFRPKLCAQGLFPIKTKSSEREISKEVSGNSSKSDEELKLLNTEERNGNNYDFSENKKSKRRPRSESKNKLVANTPKRNLFFASGVCTSSSNYVQQSRSCLKTSKQTNSDKRNKNLQVRFSKMSISSSQENLNGNADESLPVLTKLKSKIAQCNNLDSPWCQNEQVQTWNFAEKKQDEYKKPDISELNDVSPRRNDSTVVKRQIKWMDNPSTIGGDISQTVLDSNSSEYHYESFHFDNNCEDHEQDQMKHSNFGNFHHRKVEYPKRLHSSNKNIPKQQDRKRRENNAFSNYCNCSNYKNNLGVVNNANRWQANTGNTGPHKAKQEITVNHTSRTTQNNFKKETSAQPKEIKPTLLERKITDKTESIPKNEKSQKDFKSFRWNARGQNSQSMLENRQPFSRQPEILDNKNLKHRFENSKNKCENAGVVDLAPLAINSKQALQDQGNVSESNSSQTNLLFIHYGEDISDAVVGSFTAMNVFLSFYKEWKELRNKTVLLLEELLKMLTNSNNRSTTMQDVVRTIGYGAKVASVVPLPSVALVGKIVSALSDIFGKLFDSSPTLKNAGVNDFELMLCLEQDIEATSVMYMYGLQCDQQFQEACKLIEMFHRNIQRDDLNDFTKSLETEFMREMSRMNPNNHAVYYRRFQKWLENFKYSDSSDLTRAFSRSFKDWPEALEIVTTLPWRFKVKCLDGALKGWEEICQLLQNETSLTVQDILPKIKSSLLVLVKERTSLERDVYDLLKHDKSLARKSRKNRTITNKM